MYVIKIYATDKTKSYLHPLFRTPIFISSVSITYYCVIYIKSYAYDCQVNVSLHLNPTAQLINSWGKVVTAKIIVARLVKKFLTFCGTRGFIIVFTRAPYCALFWASSVHYTLFNFRIRPNITSPSMLMSRMWSLPFWFTHAYYMLRPSYVLFLIKLKICNEEYKLYNFSVT